VLVRVGRLDNHHLGGPNERNGPVMTTAFASKAVPQRAMAGRSAMHQHATAGQPHIVGTEPAATANARPSSLPPAHSAHLIDLIGKSRGSELPRELRWSLEAGTGRDLGNVTVHTGPEASDAATELGARAFAYGTGIYFKQGQFRPGSEQGNKLVAHEVAHVVQDADDTATRSPSGSGLAVSSPTDSSEISARRIADSMAVQSGLLSGPGSHQLPGLRPSSQPVIHRDMDPAAPGPTQFPSLSPASNAPDLLANASPFLAASIASTTVDGFPTGSSDLNAAQTAELKKVASRMVSLLVKYPASTVAVIGHTDTVGTEASNVALGAARADSAKAVLIASGVPENIISTDSSGEAPPQAVKTPDETPNAKNRRVEVRFRPQEGVKLPPPAAAPPPAAYAASPTLDTGPRAQGSLGGATGNAPQTDPFAPIPPSEVKQIKDLNDALNATADAVRRDTIVHALRDAIGSVNPDAGKAIDDAIKQGVPAGILAAIKAGLQAIAKQSGTDMPDPATVTHTPADMPPGAPGENIKKLPPLPSPIDRPPEQHKWTSFQFKNGPKGSYKPGEQITFAVVPPSNFMTIAGGKRVVIVSEADRTSQSATRLATQTIESGSPQQVTLTAPQTLGKYYIRVDIGLGFEDSSMQMITVEYPKFDPTTTY
jgi:outer membrane protein OmpA-like peptidoglycan-associated protein